ncbi:MAG: 16S rRNA processing protein RimM [Leptospiraceae bacterium]|nr:16S rRNA processing protein RimM [Leptospiraceae bacterium]
MIDDFISIGKITSTFGLKGFLKVASSGDILSSLKANSLIYLSIKEELKPFKLRALRKDKNIYIVSLEGYNSIEESQSLVGQIFFYPKKDTQSLLETDEYFIHQLIGLSPYYQEQTYSDFKVAEVLENPVHPILLFSNSVTEILVPYINRFVGKVDLEHKRIEILNWAEWLLAD